MKHADENFMLAGKIIKYTLIGAVIFNLITTVVLILLDNVSYSIQDLITRVIFLTLVILVMLFIAQIVRLIMYYQNYKNIEHIKVNGIITSLLLIPVFVLISFLTMVILALRSFS